MKEALKLALEALESGVDTQIGRVAWTEYDSCLIVEAITAIKEALAQPVQEPVAWAIYHKGGGSKSLHWPEQHSPNGDANMFDAIALYTTPKRPWVGLTDEEASWCQAPSTIQTWKRIETKLKEKNT